MQNIWRHRLSACQLGQSGSDRDRTGVDRLRSFTSFGFSLLIRPNRPKRIFTIFALPRSRYRSNAWTDSSQQIYIKQYSIFFLSWRLTAHADLFIQFHFFSSGPRHRSGRVVCVLRLIEPQNALILISFPKCIAQNDRTKVLNYYSWRHFNLLTKLIRATC